MKTDFALKDFSKNETIDSAIMSVPLLELNGVINSIGLSLGHPAWAAFKRGRRQPEAGCDLLRALVFYKSQASHPWRRLQGDPFIDYSLSSGLMHIYFLRFVRQNDILF